MILVCIFMPGGEPNLNNVAWGDLQLSVYLI